MTVRPPMTPLPTLTVSPRTPVPLATNTRLPTATLPAMTAEAVATIAAFGDLCQGDFPSSWNLSTVGGWVAAECNQDVVVMSLDHQQTWRVRFSDVYSTQDGYRDGTLYPRHWTKDGRYLFVGTYLQIDGELYYCSGMGLLRLDLKTGRVSDYITPQESAFDFYSFSFSPEDKYLWYIFQRERPLSLDVLELVSGANREFELPANIWGAGFLAWRSDFEVIAFSARTTDEVFMIGMLNLSSGDITLVATPENRILLPVDWANDTTVNLREAWESEKWVYQVDTNEIVQGE